jgi:hypothetical protein
MKQIKYALFLYLGGKQIATIQDVDSLPSFKIGDALGLRPFNPAYDNDTRAIVTDVFFMIFQAIKIIRR